MPDTSPLVSIITPAYNNARYLDETINSVLGQGYPHIEYIVLDDGSTDNTREVLEKYTGQLIWETHPNMGETRTVNKGWSMAHGDIVAVVNSDDLLLPGAVREAVAFMETHPDILVAYPDWNIIGPDSKVTGHSQVPEYDYLFMLKRHYCMPGPGTFIRRKAFDLVAMRDPEFKYVADFEFWLRLGLYGPFAHIQKTLASWRAHPDAATLSSKGTAMSEEYVRLIEKFYSRPDLPQKVLRVRREAFAWAHVRAAQVSGEAHWVALKHSYRAVLWHPTTFLGFGQTAASGIIFPIILPKPLFEILFRAWRMVRPILARGYRFIKQLRKRLRA